MNDKITQTVEKYHMLANGDTVLIALSGGADSVFLAEYLLSVKKKYNLKLIAAHVEHGIRGSESLADCEFCEKYCKEKKIPIFVKHIDAPAEAKKAALGVEEFSRQARYSFFYSIECDKIATAHSLSDNAETLLFRLARGTSLKGACAIPPTRNKIIRPLINIASGEIRDYLDEHNILYCTDSTNTLNDYSRNYIRNVIIPALKKINPAFESNASRFIESALTDEIYLEKQTSSAYDKVCLKNVIICDALKKYDKAIINRVIAKWLDENKVPVSSCNLYKAKELLYKSSSFSAGRGQDIVSEGGVLKLAYKKSLEDFEFIVDKKIIPVKEFLTICEFGCKRFDFFCDCDKIIGNVNVRSRMPGDSITLNGRGCTKSLKKLYNELHIPADERTEIPVIADDFGVIGVCGFAVSQRVAVNDKTQNVLTLNIRTEDLLNE